MDPKAAINRRIFETSLDLILVVDRQGRLIRVSPSSFAIVGYRPDEMVGRSAREFLFADDLDATRNEMRRARRGRLMRNFDCRYVHKGGRVVPLAWTDVWSEAEQQHFSIGRDMTERLEVVGQLTGGIAHDFNNLLAVVIGNLDLLEGELGGRPEAAQFTANALAASLRGAELTRQLLAFARRQSLDTKVIDINERVAKTLDLLKRTLGENIEIATVQTPDLWPAFADPVQFDSALVNLAINARDAMKSGGRLTVETENRRLDEVYARREIEVTPGDYVMVAVSDTGTGMPPDVLTRVFEPFFTTKPPGEGSGLGLSMVYGFARQSQGPVKIYSEVRRGTTVRLYLPRARSEAEPAADVARDVLPGAREGERVLVVEDNVDVLRVVLLQLRSLGYQVVEAVNANEALVLLNCGEPLDLLFSDVVMPGGLSGDELARAAQEMRPGLKVLLTSGFSKASVQGGRQSAQFRHFLSKPYRKADLAVKLREVLDGEA